MDWEEHWTAEARSILKAELKRRRIGYKELAHLLPVAGGYETPLSITHKLARGRFQFAFFLQCLWAIGVRSFHLEMSGPEGVSINPSTPAASERAIEHSKQVSRALKDVAKKLPREPDR